MADAKDGLEFVEGGVGLLADLGGEFGGVKFAPVAPTGLGGERVGLYGGEVAVDGAFPQREALGGLGPRAAALNELHHPLPQIQRVGFHAPTLPDILTM